MNQRKDDPKPIDLRGWIPPVEPRVIPNALDLREVEPGQDFYEALAGIEPIPQAEGISRVAAILLSAVFFLMIILAGTLLGLQ